MGKRIIYLGGTFDLLHSGHIALFKKAKRLGTVVVSLNTDEFCERYKRKPIMPLKERKAVIQACKYMDKVIVNTGCEDSKPAILRAKATHILHGDDWTGESYRKQLSVTSDWLRAHNIKIIYRPYTKGISTTQLCQRFPLSASPTAQAQPSTFWSNFKSKLFKTTK